MKIDKITWHKMNDDSLTQIDLEGLKHVERFDYQTNDEGLYSISLHYKSDVEELLYKDQDVMDRDYKYIMNKRVK